MSEHARHANECPIWVETIVVGISVPIYDHIVYKMDDGTITISKFGCPASRGCEQIAEHADLSARVPISCKGAVAMVL